MGERRVLVAIYAPIDLGVFAQILKVVAEKYPDSTIATDSGPASYITIAEASPVDERQVDMAVMCAHGGHYRGERCTHCGQIA